jgi:hypothetical protein
MILGLGTDPGKSIEKLSESITIWCISRHSKDVMSGLGTDPEKSTEKHGSGSMYRLQAVLKKTAEIKKRPVFTTALIAGDCVILDAIHKAGLLSKIDVLFIDTFFLFPETLDFLREVENHYGFKVRSGLRDDFGEVCCPSIGLIGREGRWLGCGEILCGNRSAFCFPRVGRLLSKGSDGAWRGLWVVVCRPRCTTARTAPRRRTSTTSTAPTTGW